MYSAVRMSKTENTETFTRQGSLRKVIAPERKENLFGRQNEDLNKLYKKFHQEYSILAEYKMLQSENLQGVYVIPSRENQFLWFGVLFVRSGLYEDGIFRFTVTLDENFPDGGHPNVTFISDVFHPVIDPETKQVNLLNAFPTWNKSEQHIWQIFKYLHWIFYNIPGSLNHSINKEAADLYRTNPEAFKAMVQEIVKISQEQIYEQSETDDKHYLNFDQYDPQVHEQVKSTMLTEQKDNFLNCGYSWVFSGSFKPMGRPPSPDSEGES